MAALTSGAEAAVFLIAPEGCGEFSSDGFCRVHLLEIQKLLARFFSATPEVLWQPSDRGREYWPG